MIFVLLLVLGSIALALTVLVASPPADRPRDWRLRSSWALWALQRVLLFGTLLASLTVMER